MRDKRTPKDVCGEAKKGNAYKANPHCLLTWPLSLAADTCSKNPKKAASKPSQFSSVEFFCQTYLSSVVPVVSKS